MVKGLDIFKKYFADYTGSYVIIGGTARDIHITEAAFEPKGTRDSDIILLVEALNPAFAKQFWKFIEEGNYELKEVSAKDRKYYRFTKPANTEYPNLIELFSRKPDVITLNAGAYLTPIPVGEGLTSLSAISVNDEYYNYLIKHRVSALKEPFNIADIKDSIQKGTDRHMLVLNIHFLKYMAHHYKMPFVFSEWIWNFIATTKIFGRHKGVENWFYIDAKMLDNHINDRLDSFLGSNELEIFGKVWGLDFVFDFLNQHQLLSDEHYETMLENISYFRNEMMRIAGGNLWQMMFVCKWPRTNNYAVDPSEKRMFNETYGLDETEAFEKVKRYLSIYCIPDRIKNELKLNNSDKGNHLPFWTYNTPHIKQETVAGRNDLCPCGSGKKYKKCCLNK